MPENEDYTWLGSLLEHPEKWSPDDLASAEFMLANQRRALEDVHPRDVERRRSLLKVVDRLEAAIRSYDER